jgi:hypothetical protein
VKITGTYPDDWPDIAKSVKDAALWCCVRCGHKHDRATGHVLTTHHLNGDKSDVRWWNLVALCQRCHLRIQGKVDLDRPWFFEHSIWFRPFVAGFYAWKYLGLDLTRKEVMERLGELVALESQALLGCEPVAWAVSE